MSNVNYIVDSERGIVRAVLKGTKFDAVRSISKIAKGTSLVSDKKYLIANSFKAQAKCNFDDGDTFDAELGKKLALKRLMTKLNVARAKAIADYIDDRNAEQDILNDALIVIHRRLDEASESKVEVKSVPHTVKVVGNGSSSIGGAMVKKMIENFQKSNS